MEDFTLGNLKAVRRGFVEATGRYDLTTSDWSDNGADAFINAGQRFLDDLQETPVSKAVRFSSLVVGQVCVLVPDVQAIEEVWFTTSEGARTKLNRLLLTEFREKYPTLFDETSTTLTPRINRLDENNTSSVPVSWTIATSRIAPDQNITPAELFRSAQFTARGDMNEVVLGSYSGHVVVMIAYPPDETGGTLRVAGRFYSQKLENDTDRTFWTERYPDVLIMAAAYKMEIFYRNMTGAGGYKQALDIEMNNIDKNLVRQAMVDADQMKG